MDWEGNEWADSEWTTAETVKEDVASALEPLPKSSPAAVLTPEIDDIHAWEDVLEERSSPRPASKDAGDVEEKGGADTTDKPGAEASGDSERVSEATQQLQKMQLEEEEESEDDAPEKTGLEAKPNALGLAPPISASSISVDDPHWGSDVEVEEATTATVTETTTTTTTTTTEEAATETPADLETEPVVPVKAIPPLEVKEEGWEKTEVAVGPVSPVADLKEGWGESDPVPKMESGQEASVITEDVTKEDEAPLPIVEDEGWGDGADGGDWGDFEEGDGFDDPEETTVGTAEIPDASVAPVTSLPSTRKSAVQNVQLEFPQPMEELVEELRGSKSAQVEDNAAETPILSYREKSRKLYNSLIRPNCQFIESKRTSSDDTVVKWRGSEFEKVLKGEIKKLHENDSKNLKRVFKFGWSNGGAERSGSRGRPLSMPPPKNNESAVQIPGLSRSSTMSRASTASPAPPTGGLTRSSSLRERGRDMTRNKPQGLVQTAIAGAVGQRVASNSPSMSPTMSPPPHHHHHHHALSGVFGSKSKSHSKSSSISSITSPLDSPIDSPMDSPLGSPILTNLVPTLSPTLTGTPPSGPSRSATPTNSVPSAAIPEEDSFADFISASPVVSKNNSPIASPKIGSPAASPLGSKVTSPRMSHPQISSPLAANGNNDFMGLDLWGSNIAPNKTQPTSTSKPAESPLDDFFGSTAKKPEPASSDFFGSTSSNQKVTTPSGTTGNQFDDIFGSFNSAPKTTQPSQSTGYGSKSSDFDIFDAPQAKTVTRPPITSTGNGSEFDIFNSAPVKQTTQPPAAPLKPSSTGLSGFEIFDKPSSTPSIQIDNSQAEDEEWGDFTDSVATNNRPRKNSYNSAADVSSHSQNVPSSKVAQSISQSSTQSLFDTTFLDSAVATRHKSKSPSRSPVAPMKLAKKPVAFELDMGPLQPGSKYKQQSEDKLVNDIVSSLPNLDFMASM